MNRPFEEAAGDGVADVLMSFRNAEPCKISVAVSQKSVQFVATYLPTMDVGTDSGSNVVTAQKTEIFGSTSWIWRRLALGLVVLFLVSVVVFAATLALPSDPARSILGRDATPERLEALRQQLGLDRPLVVQYASWFRGFVTGDLGVSLASRRPVIEVIQSRILNSAVLITLTAALAFPLSVVLGALAAIRRDSTFDKSLLFISLVLTALPEFVVGMALIIVFSTTVFRFFPAVALIPPNENILSNLHLLILPIATLVLAIAPYLYRLVRNTMIDVLESDYVQMARLKGLPEAVVTRRHALRNSLVPLIQASAMMMVYLLGGIVVVEFLFRFPGLGTALTDAVSKRDFPVIQAIVLIFAAAIVIFNLIADILTVYLTPRLRMPHK